MTKKLIWRLSERPTTKSLIELVNNKLLTKEEAIEILLSSETEEDRDKKSLESEIKFLRELVEKLSTSRLNIITTIKEIEVPYREYPWYEPYKIWYSTSDTLTSGSGTGTVSGTGSSYTTFTSNNSFIDIKTF